MRVPAMNRASFSVCVRCGATKTHYADRCEACGFVPQSESDLGASISISSDAHFPDLDLPRTVAELEVISAQIRSGQPFSIDSAIARELVQRASEVRDFAANLTWARLIFLYFLPVLIVVASAIYVVISILRA
jgi:hypothetical protein